MNQLITPDDRYAFSYEHTWNAAQVAHAKIRHGGIMNTENEIKDRANDIFYALPDIYTKHDVLPVMSNIDDYWDHVSHDEKIAIVRALRDSCYIYAGAMLDSALKCICLKLAQDEADDARGEDLP